MSGFIARCLRMDPVSDDDDEDDDDDAERLHH